MGSAPTKHSIGTGSTLAYILLFPNDTRLGARYASESRYESHDTQPLISPALHLAWSDRFDMT